ncbi:hypothetical protein KP509_32G050600 [Ceratopteris richardii]|uniref:Transcription factor CBF/NF-Y/archaeal histone domain-containing protein n=1 Tax=Ceratopteris richardii TaxID=49495 RepID=A0A8T2QTA4_CERRI|nr:hypothetical protein KP509_32G050600 [Ceratopteris richardii]
MRKKHDTRFPVGRIKKIMQADEEVGKIAMATPILISKALERFLQDLCDRTYEVTLKRGAKTISSTHLKECVHTHSMFDFLKETVSHVRDLQGRGNGCENTVRRRKAAEVNMNVGCEDDSGRHFKMGFADHRVQGGETGHDNRRKSKKRSRNYEEDEPVDTEMSSPSPCSSSDFANRSDIFYKSGVKGAQIQRPTMSVGYPKDLDLNVDLDEDGEVAGIGKQVQEDHNYSGISLFPASSQNVYQQEDDYDEEGV